jgi:hypothetical protein
VLRDLDLFSCRDLIQEGEDLGLGFRSGQFFGHVGIILVISTFASMSASLARIVS